MHGHPITAYLKAFLIRIGQGMVYMTQLRSFLLAHPLLIIELGFQLHLDPTAAYGFDPEKTLPCRYWFSQKLRTLDPALLQALLHATVRALKVEIPGLGEVVAFDVKHIYAGSKKIMNGSTSKSAMTKHRSWQVIPIASSVSNEVRTRSKLMERPKRKKNSFGAMAQHGHHKSQRDHDGVPLCEKGLRMQPSFSFHHTNGYRAQRFCCPLLFPCSTGQTCDLLRLHSGQGCQKDPNWELGGIQRVTLDRDGPLYHALYTQRTACERINSQAKELGIERPKVQNGRSVANLNTLIYIIINVRTLKRAKTINRGLLQIR